MIRRKVGERGWAVKRRRMDFSVAKLEGGT
jgi:hypothetical protein